MQRHAFPVVKEDARGKRLRLEKAPERIVSLVPSQTELLHWLGLEDKVVGITRFCVHPEPWREEKTVVGGTKQLNQGTVSELQPDLILANKEENTAEMVEALEALAPVYVTDVATLSDALDMIESVGRLTGTSEAADNLASQIDVRFSSLPSFAPLRAAYLIWRDPYMTVGGDTFIHDMLRHAGFVNVFSNQRRYPELTPEDLAAADLDVLLLSSEPFPFHRERYEKEISGALPGLRVEVVDGELFSWYGSRLLSAPDYFIEVRERLA